MCDGCGDDAKFPVADLLFARIEECAHPDCVPMCEKELSDLAELVCTGEGFEVVEFALRDAGGEVPFDCCRC